MVHALKTSTEFYEAVKALIKPFEVRENDRDFRVGDYLALNEYDTTAESYTGRSVIMKVTYILDKEEYCKNGYVVMGLAPCRIGVSGEEAKGMIFELGERKGGGMAYVF